MPKVYRLTVPRRLVNALVTPLVRLGLGPRHTYLLAVPGRRTGRVYRTPVTLVEHDSGRWLVAPYGERSWVKNARAAGWVELRCGRRRERVHVDEVPAGERAPILRDYLRQVPFTRDFFDAGPDAPVEAFAAEADRHPVFVVLSDEETSQGGPTSDSRARRETPSNRWRVLRRGSDTTDAR
jgi:deazaflavin-dependent oxidoreductase (nitroreductase family)